MEAECSLPCSQNPNPSLIYITYFVLLTNSIAVCFPGVTTHCGCIFHSPVAGFSFLILEVS